MSRYIEAEWLKEHIEVISYEGMWHTTETDEFVAVDNINQAPTIDIVRCGECMHNGSYDTDCPFGWRNGEWNLPKPCDFCSYGEKMQVMYYPQVDGITPSVIVNNSEKPNKSEIPTGSTDTQTYITEDRDTQILDAWQVKQM